MFYNRIDLSKIIDSAKSKNSKEDKFCHYWFFNYRFKFQDSVCNGFHNSVMLCLNISIIAIITVKRLIIIVSFMILASLKQSICWKNLHFMIVGIHKMHAKEINIKNRVCNYYFANVVKAKKSEKKIYWWFILLDMFTVHR